MMDSNLFPDYAAPQSPRPTHLEIQVFHTSGTPFVRPVALCLISAHHVYSCHSGDLFFTFGTLGESIPGTPFRDSNDLLFEQVIVDQWTSFARTFDPNPEPAFLEARGYTTTTEALKAWGAWEEVGAANRNGTNVLRLLDVPSSSVEWLEQAQCDVLGFGLNFYG